MGPHVSGSGNESSLQLAHDVRCSAVSQPIHVAGRSGRSTRIVVRDWPESRAPWRVATVDDRGRVLEVVGWHRFVTDQSVGQLELHVESRRALLITRYMLADTLINEERLVVLGALLVCAQDVATQLRTNLSVGTGCLEWQLDSDQVENIRRLFPGFSTTPKLHRLKRGKRYLRKCP
jgi:hypothetical protein